MQNGIRKRERARETRLPSGGPSLGSWSSSAGGKFESMGSSVAQMGSSMGSAMAKRRGAGLDCIGVEHISPDAGALVEGATINRRISFHDGGRLANPFFSDIAILRPRCRSLSAGIRCSFAGLVAHSCSSPVRAEIIPAPPRLHRIDLRKP